MKKLLMSALVALVLAGCGTAEPSGNPGSGSDPDTTDGGVSTENTTTDDGGTDGPGDDGALLHVVGNAPTPCHQVAYSVDADADQIAVRLTTVASDGMCMQVLQPVDVTVPLGRADLPATVTVNDGEFVTTVE